MTTLQKKSAVRLWLAMFDTITLVQHEYPRVFNEDPPHKASIYHCYKQFKETGSLHDRKRLTDHLLATTQL